MRRTVTTALAALAALVVAAPAAADPGAVTGDATAIGATTATVGGSVTPGGEETTWYVEYGASTQYGSRTSSRNAGNGTVAVDVQAQLTGLQAGQTYHYRVVAANEDGTARGADRTFTTRDEPDVTTGAASQIAPSAATVDGTVDPNGLATSWWVEYGTTTSYGSRTPNASAGSGGSAVKVSTRLTGLAAGVTYNFRIVASNEAGTVHGANRTFRTDPAPSVSTGSADSITSTAARLRGSVNPRGRGTVVWFEYGPTSQLGSRTGETDAGAGGSSRSVSASIGGLQPGTRYSYRIAARSDAGTSLGEIRTFTTASGPVVTTGTPQVTGAGTVVLSGSVDPAGRSTTWYFELGPTTRYGTRTTARSAGSGRGAVPVSETVAGLRPGTEYHVRLVAQSSGGTTRGADVAFRTMGAPTVGRTTVTAVGTTRAVVSAPVATAGLATQVWVEFGRAPGALGSRTASTALAASSAPTPVSVTVDGLEPGIRYALRVVASSAAGTAAGSTVFVGTASPPRDGGGRPARCTITGTSGPDRLVGTPGRDVICGLGGDDVLIGRGGDDLLIGGSGSDELIGGRGADTLLGGPGNDRIHGGPGNDVIHGGPGNDRIVAGAGRDVVRGGPGRDVIFARDGQRDHVDGGPGNDRGTLDRRLDRVPRLNRIA